MKKTFSILLAILLTLSIVSAAFAETATEDSGAGTALVYGPLTSYAAVGDSAWGTGSPAVATWKHASWPLITGSSAQWISNTIYIEEPIAADSWRKFTTTTPLCAGAYDVNVVVKATADNAEEVYANGVWIGSDGEVYGTAIDNQEWKIFKTYSKTLGMTNEVKVDFIVRNYAGPSTPQLNPTGLVYQIEVNYSCPIVVDIDIKPGSDPSCFNNDGNGIIPVAINGSAAFDVTLVDPGTVTLAGLAVAVKGKSDRLLAAYEDWNGDGFIDLMLKIVDVDGTFSKGSGSVNLEGKLFDGKPILGTGDICITQ